MSTPRFSIRVPAAAVRELEQVERMDWGDGIPLPDLLEWINTVVARFRPDEIGAEFTARTFRHYQTLGEVDPPQWIGQVQKISTFARSNSVQFCSACNRKSQTVSEMAMPSAGFLALTHLSMAAAKCHDSSPLPIFRCGDRLVNVV